MTNKFTSLYLLRYSLCPLNEEYFLLIINRPAKIAVVGCIDLRVVWGCLNINGYKLKPEETFTPVYSPRSHSHIVFTAESEPLLKCPNELPSKSSSFIEEQRSKLQRELQKWLERTPALEIVKQCHDEVAVMLCKKLQDSTVHYLNHFVKRMFLPFPLPKPKSSLYLPPEHGFKFCSTLCAKSLDYDSTWQQTVSHIQSYNKIEGMVCIFKTHQD